MAIGPTGASMLCPTCKTENKPGGRFCTACGSRLVLRCGSCGFANTPGDRFCGGCGNALVVPSSAAASEQALRRAAVQGRLGDGERKRVTVLFADLKGSTEAIEGLDPEIALTRLEPAVETMVRLVHRYEGVVCRRMGDGILALFGAPVAHEDHAVRACFAALGMQRELREAGMGEMVRVGLNSGDVLYRTVASDVGLEVDVVGPVVHLAARMEQLAPPGSVYLTGETQALTQGLVETRRLGPREIKGSSEAVQTYEAISGSIYRSRWQAAATRERAPFVDRDTERATLNAALSALERGRGGLIGICGEAGLGKSRLVHNVLADRGLWGSRRTTFAGATALGRNIPYHALASALHTLFSTVEGDDPQEVPSLVAATLRQLDPSLAGDAPFFTSLISLASATPQWLAMDPRHKQVAAREACVRLSRVMAARAPRVLVFEDLHWIDRESEEVLRAVAALTREIPLLVVLNYRAEYDDSWLPSLGGTRLRMAPLGDEDVRRALRDWFVEGTETERLIERLTSRVGGNPLFIEECVRAMAQRGALTSLVIPASEAGVRRRYACWEAPESIRVPPSVHDVIASRIDRRSPECVELLRTLSMVGASIPLWLATAVSGRSEAMTEAALREAVEAEILVQESLYPDVEYVFAHALLREVAHDSLTRARRVEAHRLIVEAIENHYGTRASDQAEWLALHAEAGELWEKAAIYQGQAGERALARGSYAEAIASTRAALRSYDLGKRSTEATQRAIDHLRALRALLFATGGDAAETRSVLGRAEELARSIDDRLRLAWVWAEQSAQYWVEGDNDQAIDTARRSLEIAEEAGDVRLRALALFRLGLGLNAVGDYVDAAEALAASCRMLEGELRFERIGTAGTTSVIGGGYLVFTLCELGRFDEAERLLADLVTLAAETRDIYSIASAQLTRSIVAIARGDAATAVPLLETLLTHAKAGGALAVSLFIQSMLGRAKFISGDAAGAIPLLLGKKEDVPEVRAQAHGLTKVWLAEALVALGRLDEADGTLDVIRREAERRREGGVLAYYLAAKGKVALARGRREEAATWFRRGLERAEKLSMQPLGAACKATLAAISTGQDAGHAKLTGPA
jgi:class 3 adenylate cyclase/tetratricopeptide (TPR) repeat protein